MTFSSVVDQLFNRVSKMPWRVLTIALMIGFGLSGLRHFLMETEAWDFGIFDQAVYLISQGQTPFSTLLHFHILGDHAAVIFYPIALLYKLYPSGYWLLGIQAIALVAGAWVLWQLALQAKVKPHWAAALMVIYLLYPITFNANLADFHAETIAIPSLLGAVWFSRANRTLGFCLCLMLALSCRDALGLNIAAMGIWLWIFEKKRLHGAIALVFGIGWFLIATQLIVPGVSAGAASVNRYLDRYAKLGSSYSEIAKNLILNPGLLLSTVVSYKNIEYLVLLALPVIWACHPRNWSPLIGALPTLAMNVLSQNNGQRSLTDQYSVPVLPFLMLVAVAALVNPPKWLPPRRALLAWSFVGWLALAKYGYMVVYLHHLDTWPAARDAIALIHPQERVLADARLVSQVSHRTVVEQIGNQKSFNDYDTILLNVRRPWLAGQTPSTAEADQLQQNPAFQQTFDRDGIVLFQRR